MALVSGSNKVIEEIVAEIEKMSDDEQKFLLQQLRRELFIKKSPKITKNPAKVSMHTIDKWKHDSRKKNAQ